MSEYKNIHIGSHIKEIAKLKELSISRACIFLKCSHKDIKNMYTKKSLDSDLLLRWCKLLEYNFFMFYHSHLQIYSPKSSLAKLSPKEKHLTWSSNTYEFRKNLYSQEIINWILDKYHSGMLTPKDIMEKYQIPKTTLYRWIKKHSKK